MKKTKNIILFISAITLTIIFFTYSIVVTFDSSHYLWLTSVLNKENFHEWDIIRGIVFPAFIKVFTIFLGENPNGIKVGMYIMYSIMITVSYLIYRDIVDKQNISSKIMKISIFVIYILFVAINPIIFGYFHTMLTEFIGITIGVLCCYLAWKWIEIDWNNKFKYIIYTGIFSILVPIAWQLKQPYVGTALFPLIVATAISIISKFNKRNVISKIISLIIVIISLVLSIKIWNYFLKINNVDMKESRSSSTAFSDSILSGISEYHFTKYPDFQIPDDELEKLPRDIQDTITKEKNNYKLLIIVKKPNGEYDLIFSKNSTIKTSDSIKYMMSTIKSDPICFIKGHIKNYLAICNIYKIEFEGARVYNSNELLNITTANENELIPFKIYEYKQESSYYIGVEEYDKCAQPYKEINNPILGVNWIMRKLSKVCTVIIKILFVALPFMTIIGVISFFIIRKKYNNQFRNTVNLVIILYSYSLMHILSHSVLGAIIDRYTVPAMVTTIIGELISVYLIIYKKKFRIIKEKEESI
ncbi:MAG: hypothetical protein IKF52_03180 [Clostridia bacterium]|nr:hypothetical protein [Clostridia bacterium]